jgi:hypothetical protein
MKLQINYEDTAQITVGLPYLMRIFELAETRPVVLLDATFNEHRFNQCFERYKTHCQKKNRNPMVNIYEPRLDKNTNKNTIIYNIVPKGKKIVNYGIVSLESGAFKIINSQLKKIIPILKRKQEAYAISHMAFEKDLPLGKRSKMHYFNQRGSDIDVDWLITIGTPFKPPFQLLTDYILSFGIYPDNLQTILDGNRFAGYEDKLLNSLFEEAYDEVYQACHRNRGLQNDRKLLRWGIVPKQLYDEFTVKTLAFGQFMAGLYGRKQYYLEHKDETRKVIEKLHHIAGHSNPEGDLTVLCSILCEKWNLDYDDIEEVIDRVMEPVTSKIISLLRKTRYNKMTFTKLQRNSGYPRGQFLWAIRLLEKSSSIDIIKKGNRFLVSLPDFEGKDL